MAKQQKPQRQWNNSDVNFVDLVLDRKQEEHLKSSGYAASKWPSCLSEIVSEGYKVTLKEDLRNHSVMAMVQEAAYSPEITTVIYVMRSGTAASALLKLCYYWEVSEHAFPDPDAAKFNGFEDEDLFA